MLFGLPFAVLRSVFISGLRYWKISARFRGWLAERIAGWILQWRGYRILARNVVAAGVEVDLVVWRRRVLYIVEVKSRSTDDFGGAAAAVDAKRRGRQWRAAAVLVDRFHLPIDEVSFGVVAISGCSLRIYPDAWDACDLDI